MHFPHFLIGKRYTTRCNIMSFLCKTWLYLICKTKTTFLSSNRLFICYLDSSQHGIAMEHYKGVENGKMKSNALEFILNRFAFKAELGASLIKLMSVFYFISSGRHWRDCIWSEISNIFISKRSRRKFATNRNGNKYLN